MKGPVAPAINVPVQFEWSAILIKGRPHTLQGPWDILQFIWNHQELVRSHPVR